jgi:hypothetical protein
MTQNKPFSEVSYQLISSQPIESAWEALKIDVDGHTLNYRLYATDWNQMEATLPVSQAP